MSDIFVSYSREDEDRVAALVSILEGEQWSVFWDRRIPVGQTWRSYIGGALSEADCVIVVWSTVSIDSGWVQEEADEGLKRGILVPVIFDSVSPPMGFRSIQAADLSAWRPGERSERCEALLDDIRSRLGENAGTKNTATEDRRIKKPLPRLRTDVDLSDALYEWISIFVRRYKWPVRIAGAMMVMAAALATAATYLRVDLVGISGFTPSRSSTYKSSTLDSTATSDDEPTPEPTPVLSEEQLKAFRAKGWPTIARTGDLAMVKELLSQGAPLNDRSTGELTALHLAAKAGHKEVVEYLLELQTDPDVRGERGETPLFLVAEEGHLEVARLLVNAGAAVDVSAETGSGFFSSTHSLPIGAAARAGHLPIVEYLLSRGAELNPIEQHSGYMSHVTTQRPLAQALESGNSEIALLLLNGGAQPKQGDLIKAVRVGDAALVRRFLDKGAKAKERDDSGQTAAELARQLNKHDLALLLDSWLEAK